jgi:hypothetical protein
MGKWLLSMLLAAGVAGTISIDAARAGPKMSFGQCKSRVMADARNLDGTNRNYCGRGCMVKVRACMHGEG